jgi:hypothetical protein
MPMPARYEMVYFEKMISVAQYNIDVRFIYLRRSYASVFCQSCSDLHMSY